MESINRTKLEEGKTYFFICYALVCGGKSTFFEQIQFQTGTGENKNKYNVRMVSSDQIRAELSYDMQKKNPNMTFKQCFDKVGKATAKEFDKQIKKAIDSKEDNKINIILVDKNYPQGIDKFLNLFCKDQSSQFFVVFIPNIIKPLNIGKLWFPFSLDYFIQCYLRLKNRHGHEVLNGEDEQSKYVYISFLKLFQNFDFHTHICSDVNFSSNVFTQTIDFTDESKNLEIDPDTKQFFEKVMKKIRAFDMENIKKYNEKDIDSYFKILDDKYDGKNFFEDTREKIKNEVNDLLINGIVNK
jgi:hypothetical protein